MQHTVLINGQPEDGVSAFDRGLAYGDGVFRTLAIRQGVPEQWNRQFRKLSEDCAALSIACPNENVFLSDLAQLFSDKEDGVAKIIVTRGDSARGYAVSAEAASRRIVLRSPRPAYPQKNHEDGVTLHLCQLRLSSQPRLAGIKHLNRLENVLARMEWSSPDIAEGLLLDGQGHVIEGTMSNLFMRSGDRLMTPDLSQCGVAGVTRDRVLALAPALGLQPEVSQISLDTLYSADEVVICNSLISVWQVLALGEFRWSAGGLAQQLRQGLEKQ